MFPSNLKPDSATIVGVLTAGGVYAIYNQSMPNVTDLRTAMPHNEDAEKARKHSAIASALLIGAVFVVARDLNSYIISGVALVAIDAMYKHANAVHPATGKIDASGDGQTIAPGLAQAYPVPEYSTDAA